MGILRQLSILVAMAALAHAQTLPADDAPAPPDSEITKILAQTTENALKYSRDLPDFICNQVTAAKSRSEWNEPALAHHRDIHGGAELHRAQGRLKDPYCKRQEGGAFGQ